MEIAHRPQTYTIELDFLEAWEVLNGLVERRRHFGHSEHILGTVNRRVEDKVRRAANIPASLEGLAPGELTEVFGK